MVYKVYPFFQLAAYHMELIKLFYETRYHSVL